MKIPPTIWGAISLALTACCAPPERPPQATLPINAAAVVEMTEGPDFAPNQVTIHVGDTVVWRNASRFSHTVTFDPSHAEEASAVSLPPGVEPFDSGRILPGASYWHRFTVPGTYYYVCVPHEEFGMVGVITVNPGA